MQELQATEKLDFPANSDRSIQMAKPEKVGISGEIAKKQRPAYSVSSPPRIQSPVQMQQYYTGDA
jgi:hypothetical protein